MFIENLLGLRVRNCYSGALQTDVSVLVCVCVPVSVGDRTATITISVAGHHQSSTSNEPDRVQARTGDRRLRFVYPKTFSLSLLEV